LKKNPYLNLAGNDHHNQSRLMPIISIWGK
jgi:hypothetical protein